MFCFFARGHMLSVRERERRRRKGRRKHPIGNGHAKICSPSFFPFRILDMYAYFVHTEHTFKREKGFFLKKLPYASLMYFLF